MFRRPFNRSERRLYWLCGALMLGIGGVASVVGYINAEPQLNIPPPLPVPHPNGYDVYLKAAGALKTFSPAVDPLLDGTTVTNPKLAAQRYSLSRRLAWLRANRAAFDLFDKALKMPCVVRYNRRSNKLPEVGPLRRLMKAQAARASTYELQARRNEAVKASLDLMRAAEQLKRGSSYVAFSSAKANQSYAIRFLDGVGSMLTAAQCRMVLRELETTRAGGWSYADSLSEEKWYMTVLLQEFMRTPGWRETSMQVVQSSWQERLSFAVLPKRQLIQNFQAVFDAEIANSRLPYPSRIKVPELETDPYSATLVTLFSRQRAYAEPLRNTACDLLMLRLALRAYRLEHGSYPDDLQKLAPRYLSKVPLDPFGDGKQVFRYRSDGKACRFWSIGPDGRDDGGRLVPDKIRSGMTTVGADSRGDISAVPEAPIRLVA